MTRPAELKAAIDLYRLEHPGRRVEGRWTHVGCGGGTARVVCVFCRATIAIQSAKSPRTSASRTALAAHECAQLTDYIARAPATLAEFAFAARARAEIEASPSPDLPIELTQSRAAPGPITKHRGAAPSGLDPLPIELDQRRACATPIVEPFEIELDDRRASVPLPVDPAVDLLLIELD